MNLYVTMPLFANRVDFFEFSEDEFNDSLTPGSLIQDIENGNIDVPAGTTPIERLNELIKQRDLYKVMLIQPEDKITDIINRLKRGVAVSQGGIKQLNRLLVEANFPLKTPTTRYYAFGKWLKENDKKLKDDYKISVEGFTLSPRTVEYEIDKKKVLKIRYPQQVPKGFAVRLHLLIILNWIDKKDPNDRDNSFLIMIDGSGAFDFSNIYLLLDKLLRSNFDVVLGKRPENNIGMERWRKEIELFEEYLIFVKYRGTDIIKEFTNYEIFPFPDAQAGCWGLRLDAIKDIALTARGYELEYDLLVSSLEGKKRIGFTNELSMKTNRCHSTYGNKLNTQSLKRCISKIHFIKHRLNLENNNIVDYLTTYMKGYPDNELPLLYVNKVKNVFSSLHIIK